MEKEWISYFVKELSQYLKREIDHNPSFLDDCYKNTNYKFEQLSNSEREELKLYKPFNRQIHLKYIVGAISKEDKSSTKQRWDWIVGTWGHIKRFDTTKRINELYDQEEYNGDIHKFLKHKLRKLSSISSFSKVASFTMPDKWFVYDSRVTYVINWLIFKYPGSAKQYFIIPDSYSDRRGTIAKLIPGTAVYFKKEECYENYCKLIIALAKEFPWKEFDVFSQLEIKPCMIEMLLFVLGKNDRYIDSEIREMANNSSNQSNPIERHQNTKSSSFEKEIKYRIEHGGVLNYSLIDKNNNEYAIMSGKIENEYYCVILSSNKQYPMMNLLSQEMEKRAEKYPYLRKDSSDDPNMAEKIKDALINSDEYYIK